MISVLLAVFGWLAAGRTFQILVDHQITRARNLRHWVLLKINFALICAYLGLLHPQSGLLLIVTLFISPIFISILSARINERKFQNETVELYDSLLMEVRGGRSIRESVVHTGSEARWSYPHREIVAYIVKNSGELFPNRHKGMQVRARELASVMNSGSRVGDRLKFYRDQWSLSRKLGLKVNLATKQAQVQAIVVTALYIIVSGYQIFHDWKFLGSKWFVLGTALLVIGLLVMLKIQRGFRWKT